MFHTGGSVFPKNYVMVRFQPCTGAPLQTPSRPCPARPDAMRALQTTYVDFAVKAVSIPETSAQVELYLFDLAGQSIFNVNDQAAPHVRRLGGGVVQW